jgi:hypothetical protein
LGEFRESGFLVSESFLNGAGMVREWCAKVGLFIPESQISGGFF